MKNSDTLRRWSVRAVAIIASAIIGYLFWYGWDSRKNHGLSFGYYAQFNSVSNALTRLPGIRVTYAGFNGDITLEEMFFEIDHGGRQLKIFVSEKEPLRFMAGANLEKALSELIEKESVAQSDH